MTDLKRMENEEKLKEEKKNNNIEKVPKKGIPKYHSFNDKRNDKQNQNNKIANDIFLEDKILSLIFFKKYKPLKIIGEGTFSVVYEGINITNKEKVALKIEQKDAKISLLKEEAFTIYNLKGYGILKFISFGHSKDFNILVEPLLGKSLYALYLEYKKSFTLKDICLIAIQCLNRIEYIHSKGYIHGDIKPENFLIGLNDPRIIYIIDFGLSKKYRSDRTGRHIQFCITKTMTGTARYASTNSLRGVQISRRDDLESLAYMILYFIMKKLPWQGVRANSQQNRYKKIYYMKKKLMENEAFKKLPLQIQNFYKNIKKLKFDEEPNYSKLREYFKDLLRANNFIEDENFSWINDQTLIQTKAETNLKKRKSNSQKRIMNQLLKKSTIDSSFEEKKIEKMNSYKKNFRSNIKDMSSNNENIYNSNNKEIKSINEAINIDVPEFSDNDEENNNDNDILKNKLKNALNCNKNITKRNYSESKRKEVFNKEINIANNNYIIRDYNSNNNFKSNKNEIEKTDKFYYENEKNKYTSFRQKLKREKVETDMNSIINKRIDRNNYGHCNIGKNYIIGEMKSIKDIKNNKQKKEEKKMELNIENKIEKAKSGSNIKIKNNLQKRSKSGEKCLIQ